MADQALQDALRALKGVLTWMEQTQIHRGDMAVKGHEPQRRQIRLPADITGAWSAWAGSQQSCEIIVE
jgi:hypothetical protein